VGVGDGVEEGGRIVGVLVGSGDRVAVETSAGAAGVHAASTKKPKRRAVRVIWAGLLLAFIARIIR
jgi:hypothetical protein